jgi:hypothetical protein
MSNNTQKMRGQRPIYEVSPFVPNVTVRTKRVTNKRGDMMMVQPETGEITAQIAGFWEAKEVDEEKFVKLFINGVKALAELSPAGTKAFSILYAAIQEAIGKDRVYVSFNSIDQNKQKMSRATFTRGFTELVEKEFIAPCVDLNWYFINPAFVWNGDRLAFVQEYRKSSNKKPKAIDTQTGDLFNGQNFGPEALPPPEAPTVEK